MRQPAHLDRLRRRVAGFVAENDVLLAGERPLLLLSGGADSMALLDLVRDLDRRLGLDLTPAALHVDYRTRGAASDRDREIVTRACAAAAVPLEVVRLAGKPSGAGFQERARRLRYDAAARIVAAGDADVIVAGHNRDDQAETVLYRLAKYAAPTSLVGMRPRDATVARPLLCLGAAEIRAYCRDAGIEYGDDETNATTAYARNLVRHEVVPALARINPAVVETLAQGADIAALEQSLVTGLVDEAWGRVALAPRRDEIAALDAATLAAEAPALRRLCLRRLAASALGDETLLDRRSSVALERLAATRDGSGRVSLRRGFEARRDYARVSVGRRAGTHACPPVALVPGATVEFCGRSFSAEVLPGPGADHATGTRPPAWSAADGAREAWIAVDRPDVTVTLRHPRRGERFVPLGMAGPVLVSSFLAAAKVPASARPLTVAADLGGEVVWLCPGRIADPVRVTSTTAYTLHIREEES